MTLVLTGSADRLNRNIPNVPGMTSVNIRGNKHDDPSFYLDAFVIMSDARMQAMFVPGQDYEVEFRPVKKPFWTRVRNAVATLFGRR